MKQNINEIKRMQQLAGLITESEYQESIMNETKTFTPKDVKTILANNGIDDDYFEDMGGQEVEEGTEEWLGVISDITGKSVDELIDDLTPQEEAIVMNFIKVMNSIGIELI